MTDLVLYKFSKKEIDQIQYLAHIGLDDDTIAGAFKLTPEEFSEHAKLNPLIRQALAFGDANGSAKVAGKMFQIIDEMDEATGVHTPGAVAATGLLYKHRCMKEKAVDASKEGMSKMSYERYIRELRAKRTKQVVDETVGAAVDVSESAGPISVRRA